MVDKRNMAVLRIFTVVTILLCIWQPTAGQIPGVYLFLNGTRYANNSEIPIFEIGRINSQTDVNEALQCVTSKGSCCKMSRTGEWYFPNGIEVPIEGRAPKAFYRNRGDNGRVNLNRVSENVTSPTGRFYCVVPDENDVNQVLYVNIELDSESTTTTLSASQSGYYPYIIGGSIAGAVAASVIITIPITVVTFVLVLHYCRKRRFPRKHQYPPSAVRYTSQRNAGKQQSDIIGNCDDVTKSSDTQEEYDDIIKPGTGTNCQNLTRTREVTEEEYDDIIKSGTTKYWNLTHQTEEEEYDDIVPH